jgi:hypothetical protein
VDVYEYFATRERECQELSLVPDTAIEDLFAEEEGSNGQRGIMWGRLALSERAFLSVLETVVVRGSGIHRERYSYYLIFDGVEIWGYDRDPLHDPKEHMHEGLSHDRKRSGPVIFKDIAEKAWERVSELEESTPEQ